MSEITVARHYLTPPQLASTRQVVLRRPLADPLEAITFDFSVRCNLRDFSVSVTESLVQFRIGRLKQTAFVRVPTKFLTVVVLVTGFALLCSILSVHVHTAAQYSRARESEKEAEYYLDPAFACLQSCWKPGFMRPETRLSCATECLTLQ